MGDYANVAAVPMKTIGPVRITGPEVDDTIHIPMATYESPLWPSTNRGAKVSRLCGGISAVILKDQMTRSIVLEAPDNLYAAKVVSELESLYDELEAVVATTSRFAKLVEFHTQVLGNLLYIRFAMHTGDASGHNMVTKAADHLMSWILQAYDKLKHQSVSGNFCVDKKVSAVNGILGRGKYVVAESVIPRQVCTEVLKTTPEKIVDLHIKKNLIGSNLAGGIRTANAHYANMLLGVYLATGQDAANIIEGSQGIDHAEVRGQDLYFSVTLPNIIVGTVGNGKHLEFVQTNLEQMGCLEAREPGDNARRLAIITAAAVWCGELSLLAAQTNPGELMQSHFSMERMQETRVKVLADRLEEVPS